MVTIMVIEIGLKNGMSKVSVLLLRGYLNVFCHGSTLDNAFSPWNPTPIKLFLNIWRQPSGLKMPKMKSMNLIWVYGFEKMLSLQGIPNRSPM